MMERLSVHISCQKVDFNINLITKSYCLVNKLWIMYFFSLGLQNAVGRMQKFREENIKQRLDYLNKEKQMLDQFEIQPMLNE